MKAFVPGELNISVSAGSSSIAPSAFAPRSGGLNFDVSKKIDTSLENLLIVSGQEDLLKTLQASPNLYGVIGALYETNLTIGNFALDVIPGAKYLRPDDREEYLKMDLQHQVRAGLYEALGASLFTPGATAWMKLAGRGFKAGAGATFRGLEAVSQRVAPKLKLKPIEDLAKWTTRDYETSLKTTLRKKQFHTEEVDAIYKWFDGDTDALRQGLIMTRLNNKTPSKGFEKALVRRNEGIGLKSLADAQGKDFWLDYEFMRKLDPSKLRLKDLHKSFIKTTSQQELYGKKYGREYIEIAYKTEAAKYYGKDVAKKLTLKEASETELINFAESMLNDKRAVLSSMGTPVGAGLNPVRWVFGRGTELGFNTYAMIYERMIKMFGLANEYTIAKTSIVRAMWEQRGLGKIIMKGAETNFKLAPGITKSVKDKAWKVLLAEDNLYGGARKIGTKEAYAEAESAVANLIDKKSPDHTAVSAIVDATHDLFDLLYGEDALFSITKEFGKRKMTASGRVAFEKKLADITPRIKKLFETGASQNYVTKHQGIETILRELKESIPRSVGGRNRWFQITGKKLEKDLEELTASLTLSSEKGGRFIEYLEGYMARVSSLEKGMETEVFNALATKHTPFYLKAREMAVNARPMVELEQLIVARIRAQAKRMYVYDELGEVAKFAGKLPEQWRNYTEHYIARALNLPSRADETIAKVIGSTVGRFQAEPWNAARVMNLAKNVNDLSYMGFLGLKPFSAARNLFQPFLLVPADLGGIKDYQHLVKGMGKAMKKETRDYLKGIGIVSEFAPETARATQLFGATSTEWAGISLPSLESTRDFCLWLFKNSDKFNRYLTGGAAMSKWEGALAQVGGKVTPANLQKFMSKAGINGRHSWVKEDLKMLLEKGHLGDAKAGFIRDVVADTQYLYGKLDSPLISQTMGATGRTLAIFQSWWMNYGHLLNKWIHTGQSPTHILGAHGAQAERAITWMMSAAVGYVAMEKAWGTSMAFRSTFLGPFPDMSKGTQMPPAWQPVINALGLIGAAGESLQDASFEPLGKQGLALINSVTNFIPGALQGKMMFKATRKEGFEGFSRSILRLGGKGSLWDESEED